MRAAHARRLAIVGFAAFAACKYPPLDALVGDAGGSGGPGGTGGPCQRSGDCITAAFPVCDTHLSGGTCVVCTTDDTHACGPTTPVCVDDRCTPCTEHSDCPDSNVCLPDGSCARSSDVAYLDGNGGGTDNALCTKQMPCIKLPKALAAKSIIKTSGTILGVAVITDRTAMIFGDDDAQLRPGSGEVGPILQVRGSSDVAIYDLLIYIGTGPNLTGVGVTLADSAKLAMTRVTLSSNNGNGIAVSGGSLICTLCSVAANSGHGIEATAGSITVTRSYISGNFEAGIRVSGNTAFHVLNNFIGRNGQNGHPNAGGISLEIDTQAVGAPPNELRFNSISGNLGPDVGKGIHCVSGTALVASNNIVWSNGATPASDVQVSGTGCSFTYSDIGPVPETSGTNLSVDPGFKSVVITDLHVPATSAVLGKADPAADLTGFAATDLDGDARVKRPGMAADIGADQYNPP